MMEKDCDRQTQHMAFLAWKATILKVQVIPFNFKIKIKGIRGKRLGK
jgi:hypothetical protein